jgi:hypothetical protein
MKKEIRVYLVDLCKISDDQLLSKKLHTCSDEKFMDEAEAQGYVYSLPIFQNLINLGKISNFNETYIRFVEVDVYELQDLENGLYDYSAE